MSTEYKLSYTAADIDERLGKIDTLETQINQLSSQNTNEIPDYWEEHLTEKIATIKELQRAGGKDCFSYVAIADFHHPTNKVNYSPALIKRVMDECGIRFCLCLGDIQSGGAWGTKGLEMADWAGVEKDFAPIRDRTLMIPGNHDGAYGKADINGDGEISGTTDYYIYNLTHDEMYDLVYRKVSLINGVTFDESYNGYYVDDTAAKVRYILVNTHYSDGATNEDGTAVNNYMRKIRVGQPQMDMVIDALQSVPTEDWHVVVGMHIPLAEVGDSGPSSDMVLLRDTLETYQNRAAYTNTFGTVGAYDYISLDVDFSSAKGRVAGVFCGHIHEDDVNTEYAFPVITSMSDQTSIAKIDGVVVPGEVGTVSEQSFDVFTVNKRDDAIYATKIGYGSDRVFSIGSAYVVTLSLDGASASNVDVLVTKDGSYSNTITAKAGYKIDTVTVTMGGVDITANAYANGVITIDSVTGDIVVTVTSTVLFTNLVDPDSEDWLENSAYNAGVIEEWSYDYRTTNYIPVTQYDILRWKGLDMENSASGAPVLVLYDETKTFINALSLLEGGNNTIFPVMTTDENGVTSYEILMRGDTGQQFVYGDYCTRVKYVRFRCHNGTPVEDIIITVNEEIYPSEDDSGGDVVLAYTNLADPTSEDWYSESHYLNKGVLAEEANSYYNTTMFVTNFIPVVKTDVLRWVGIDMESGASANPPHIACYDVDKNFLRNVNLRESKRGTADGLPASAAADDNGVTAWEIMIRGDTNEQFVYNNLCDKIRYVRFCAHWLTTEDDIVITVNEEIL